MTPNDVLIPLGWTLLISVGSVTIALLGGVPLGYWLSALGIRVRSLIAPVLALPFFLPTIIIGVIVVPFLNRDESSALILTATLILIQGLINVGFVALTASSTLAGIPAAHRESATLEGATRGQIAKLIELPQLRGALASVSLLIALYSATNYSLAQLLGRGYVSTLEIEIAKFAFRELDFAAALLLGLVHMLLTSSLFVISSRLGGDALGLNLFGGDTRRMPDRQLVRPPLLLATGGWIFAALLAALLTTPLIRSLSTSTGFGLDNYMNLATRGERKILDVTVLDASLNSARNLALTLLIALPIAWLLSRVRGSRRVFARTLGVWPAAISPVVLGLAVLVLASQLGLRATEAWPLLPLTQALVALPLLTLLFSSAYAAMDRDLLDAASVDGASALQRWWFVEIPLLRAPLSTGVLFASLAGLGEFAAASFLTLGSQTTLPLAIYQLAARPGQENLGMAMAATTIFIGFGLLVLLVQRKLSRN